MKNCWKCKKDLGDFPGHVVTYVRHGYHTLSRARPDQKQKVYCSECGPAVAGHKTIALAKRCRVKKDGPPPCIACKKALERAEKLGLVEVNNRWA